MYPKKLIKSNQIIELSERQKMQATIFNRKHYRTPINIAYSEYYISLEGPIDPQYRYSVRDDKR